MNYNYESFKENTPFELYKQEDDDSDKSIKSIWGIIKYNLKDKTESLFAMLAETASLNKMLFKIDDLPLGCAFVELINIDTNLLENAIINF